MVPFHKGGSFFLIIIQQEENEKKGQKDHSDTESAPSEK